MPAPGRGTRACRAEAREEGSRPFPQTIALCVVLRTEVRLFAQSRKARSQTGRAPLSKKGGDKTKFYTNKPTWYANPEGEHPRDKHVTISVLKYRADKLSAVDAYLGDYGLYFFLSSFLSLSDFLIVHAQLMLNHKI